MQSETQHEDAAGAPEEQGQTRTVGVEQGQRGDGNAEGRQAWKLQGTGGGREWRVARPSGVAGLGGGEGVGARGSRAAKFICC